MDMSKAKQLNRRNFLKQVSLWSAGTLLIPPVFVITPEVLAASDSTPDILVVKGKDYPVMTRKLVDSAGGMGKFVSPGDRVVIKPNIGWDRNVSQGANTHPLIVSTLASLALDKMKDKRVKCTYVDDREFVPVNPLGLKRA